jgi:hypothetical protein
LKAFLLSHGFFHFLLAIALLPLQQFMPEAVKLLFAPYVFYLVWSVTPLYLPALITWVTPGTTIAYAILISCLLVTVWNIRTLLKLRLGLLLFLSLLPLPIFLSMTFIRVSEMSQGLVQTLIPLGFYLGLFPFYYGVLASKKLDRKAVNGIFLALFILPLFQLLPILGGSIRVYWLSYPVFLTVVLYVMYRLGRKTHLKNVIIIFSFIFLLLNPSPKFTLLFSGLLGAFLAVLKIKGNKYLLSFFTGKKAILLFMSVLVFVIYSSESAFETLNAQNTGFDDRSYYESWDSFKDKVYFKAFGDRAPIWVGGWEAIMANNQYFFFPPYEPYTYSTQNAKGHFIEDSDIGIHNLLLELMRTYGFSIGLIVFFTYILFLIQGAGRFLMNKINNNIYLILLAAGTIGSGFVGALVGQFPLITTFSMSIISLFGLFYGLIQYRSQQS